MELESSVQDGGDSRLGFLMKGDRGLFWRESFAPKNACVES